MSCLPLFIGSISISGVDPPAYSKFVDYTTETLLPTDNKLARSLTNLFSGLAGGTILSVIIIVFIILLFVVLVLTGLGQISVTYAICVLVFAVACLAIYFAIGYVYARKTSSEVAIPLQQEVRRSLLLIANSVIRDSIYLSLCA